MTPSPEIRWHPLGKPLPRGWKLAQDKRVMSVSNLHQVMIEPTRKPQKTARRIGLSYLHRAMPLGWVSAQKLADKLGKPRDGMRRLLAHALRQGWVERRKVECRCCASSIFEYRRVK